MIVPTTPLDLDGRPHVKVAKWHARLKPIHVHYGRLTFCELQHDGRELIVVARCDCGGHVRTPLGIWRARMRRSCKPCGHASARASLGIGHALRAQITGALAGAA